MLYEVITVAWGYRGARVRGEALRLGAQGVCPSVSDRSGTPQDVQARGLRRDDGPAGAGYGRREKA